MAVYERETRVRAPLEDVWEFHSTTDGLEALTPGWLGLRVESITGPDGRTDPDVLETGTEIEVSVRPFGVGPRQRWRSLIVERRQDDRSATFRDLMLEGPFPRWEHTHTFEASGDATVIRDRVEYELPVGPCCGIVDRLGIVGFEPMFWHRHRRTRAVLEANEDR